MYKRILSAVNEFLNSEVAAKYAIHLAKECGAKLYLCFIADNSLSKESFNRAEESLKRLFIQAERLGIEAETITETGDPLKRIREIVIKEKVDIVFAATRRKDIERRFYEGTLSRSLMLKLPCSVAIVRVAHIGKLHPKKILVPMRTGAGTIDEKAFFAARLAGAFGSKVFPFHSPKSITGASRRGLLKTAIKGSPVEDVLRETPCDLIIFKPRT
ncbi:MAG: universal stress protein [Nitrospirae bacterium]|nr:universal stress protein [Nitrospirota bacterium]